MKNPTPFFVLVFALLAFPTAAGAAEKPASAPDAAAWERISRALQQMDAVETITFGLQQPKIDALKKISEPKLSKELSLQIAKNFADEATQLQKLEVPAELKAHHKARVQMAKLRQGIFESRAKENAAAARKLLIETQKLQKEAFSQLRDLAKASGASAEDIERFTALAAHYEKQAAAR